MGQLFVLIVLVYLFDAATCKNQFLRFVPIHRPGIRQYYYESPGSSSPIEVDATSPQQIRIRIVDYINHNPQIKIYCRVSELDPDAELLSAYLCQTLSLKGTERCIDPKDRNPVFDNIEFSATGNRSQGYLFTSEFPVGKTKLDGFYFCKFRNKRGEIQSNFIEIQDVYFYQKAMSARALQSPKILPELSPNSFPLQLDCGPPSGTEGLPDWSDDNFPSPFRWSFCEVLWGVKDPLYECIRVVREDPISVRHYFENSILPNGTLILYGRTSASWKNMGLVCWSHLNSRSVYASYFGGNDSYTGPIMYTANVAYSDHFVRPISPTHQSITLRKGPQNGARLLAVYRANPQSVKATWSKDGNPIPSVFPEPKYFMLTFPKTIQSDYAGTYLLTVEDGFHRAEFRYDVKVVGPPEVLKPPPPLLLVIARSNATFECKIDGFTSIRLEINGIEVLNQGYRRTELTDHYPYLKDVRIHPLDIRGVHIRYLATDLVFNQGSSFGPTHTVSIVGENPYGRARVSTFVNVLPQPKVTKPPANSACVEGCFSNDEHVFNCEFDLSPYNMAYVRQTWDLNGSDVSTLRIHDDYRAKYLKLEGTRLIVQPVTEPQHVDLFSDILLTCRLRVFYPSVLEEAASDAGELAFLDPKYIVYDTRADPTMQSSLSAPMKLSRVVQQANSANMSWIAAVIIAIVIIIIIGSLTACIIMRTRGETYLLDREERLMGNDPEKELREKEVFRTYERAEEPPLRGSRCSLNDDSAEIGSDADGELDDYNLDPGKFNEEGSFIDQYTTDTHYKGTASRLPTLNRSYDPQA
ncbi:unnamed protein product [Calicophoron daubneyi]|uniref:Neurofascin/L1/NrCAM C-terminal domain-containing protein n=1 Tax=Calicophoron daubneyi TaxID=300641 RepID=A0AAV2TQ60_CALDB